MGHNTLRLGSLCNRAKIKQIKKTVCAIALTIGTHLQNI
jgi:hypothetical protein